MATLKSILDGEQAEVVDLRVAVVLRGPVPVEAVGYARRKISRVIQQAGRPVLFARVKLQRHRDLARQRPAVVDVSLDVNGQVVRAHCEGRDFPEAIDLAQEHLRDRLRHVANHRRSVVRGRAPVMPAHEPGPS